MAEARPEVKEVVAEYRRQLQALGIHPEEIYLYGSYAKGTDHEGSDIDLLVISRDFARLNLRERLEVLGVAAARLLVPIQALGYTPDEMAAGSYSPFLGEILASEAIPI